MSPRNTYAYAKDGRREHISHALPGVEYYNKLPGAEDRARVYPHHPRNRAAYWARHPQKAAGTARHSPCELNWNKLLASLLMLTAGAPNNRAARRKKGTPNGTLPPKTLICTCLATLHKLGFYRLSIERQSNEWIICTKHLVYLHDKPPHLADFDCGPLIVEAYPLKVYTNPGSDPLGKIWCRRSWIVNGQSVTDQIFALQYTDNDLFFRDVNRLFRKKKLKDGTSDWVPKSNVKSALIAGDWISGKSSNRTIFVATCESKKQVYAIKAGDPRWTYRSSN